LNNENLNVQASEEVSYDTMMQNKKRQKNREQYYFRQLSGIINDSVERTGRKDISVLEIGFNNGERLLELGEAYKDVKFTGLEVREKPVEDMKARGFDCRLVDTEIFDEFFKDGEKFDVIYGFAVLHHLSDPYKSLESIIKLLKPGGALIFIREGHPYDVVSHLHTTIMRNWEYEMNTFVMKKKRFKELLSQYTTDYYVKYDNNGIVPCFERLNSIYCSLKLDRIPFANGMTVYGKLT